MTRDYTYARLDSLARGERVHANRTADARPAEPAVTSGILREVLLVIILGVVERRRVGDLRRDAVEARLVQPILKRRARGLRGALLLGSERVDRRSILGACVVPLPHPLRRIVAFPENFQHRVVRRHLRIEDDEHDLGVAGHAGAHFPIRRIRRVAAGVADRGRVDAGRLPELPLRTPEAAHPEDRLLEAGGKRRRDAVAVHIMSIGDGHRLASTRKSLFRLWHSELHLLIIYLPAFSVEVA